MSLHPLLPLKNILGAVKSWLIFTQSALTVIFSAELQQFHLFVHHKFSVTANAKRRFSHAELCKIILEDSIECTSPKSRHLLSYVFNINVVLNFSAERSFFQLEYTENPLWTTMQQSRLYALPLFIYMQMQM